MTGEKKTVLNAIQLIGMTLLFVLGVPICIVIVDNTIMSSYNYSCGMLNSQYVILLGEEIQTMHVEAELTGEQYNSLTKVYNELVDTAFSDSNITLRMVKRYNRVLEESGISHYTLYQIPFGIKRSDGLKDGIKCRIYNNDVTKLYNDGIISENEYNTFSKMYEEKKQDKDKVTAFIEYAEQLIQSVQGN